MSERDTPREFLAGVLLGLSGHVRRGGPVPDPAFAAHCIVQAAKHLCPERVPDSYGESTATDRAIFHIRGARTPRLPGDIVQRFAGQDPKQFLYFGTPLTDFTKEELCILVMYVTEREAKARNEDQGHNGY